MGEDISEIDIVMRLHLLQREKQKNINDLTKAINSTEKLSELRNKKRTLQDELTVLQMKYAHVKKCKKSSENRKAFDLKDFKTPSSFTIDTFFTKDTCSSGNSMKNPVSGQSMSETAQNEERERVDQDINIGLGRSLSETAQNKEPERVDLDQNIVSDETNLIHNEPANNNFRKACYGSQTSVSRPVIH